MNNVVLRAPQFWWRILLVLVAIVGFITGSYSTTYLTTITTWLVLGYELVSLWWMWTRRTTDPIAPRIRFGLVTWMVFIGIIAHTMLEHGVFPFGGFAGTWDEGRESLTKLLIHYCLPLGMLIDWLAFGPRRVAKWIDLVWIAAVPLAYGLITVARAIVFPDVDDRIPYPFMEPGDRGFGFVILTLLPMLVAIDAIAVVLLGYDRLVARVRGRRMPDAIGASADATVAASAAPAGAGSVEVLPAAPVRKSAVAAE